MDGDEARAELKREPLELRRELEQRREEIDRQLEEPVEPEPVKV